MKLILHLLGLTLFISCTAFVQGGDFADTVFCKGTVITLDAQRPAAEAVAVRRGIIMAVGSEAEMRKLAGPDTKTADLKGRVMLPGFYAAHDHFPSEGIGALFLVNLNSPPIGPLQTIEDLLAALRAKAARTAPGQWIQGRGYDDTLLREQRHPTRYDLDRVSTNHPIWIVHASGHLGVANSHALYLAGITKDSPQPKGGVIRKDPATGEPTGIFEECGSLVSRLIPGFSPEQKLKAIAWADRHYVSKGVTTTVIAGGSTSSVRELVAAREQGLLHLRVVAMLSVDHPSDAAANDTASPNPDPDWIHIGAAKIWHDGSLQGYTGYLTEPYYRQPEGKTNDCGYAMRSREALVELVKKHHRDGRQIAIHGNGDAAIDDILFAYAEAQREDPRPDARHRIEHCQTARPDQLARMKQLGVTPSFFNGHVFYWGDRHRDIFLGPERAARISPLASARASGLRFTLHNDTPVTPVDPLLLMWVAVNRLTRNGQTLGPAERISVADALRAVTLDAAWQNFEEARKGSIEPGKFADFVVLDENPLTISPQKIKDIGVLETFVGGESVYKK